MHAELFLENFERLVGAPGGIQKLRGLILQLAVQGRLVSQKPRDGDARDLQVAAAQAIQALINEKSIRKPRFFEKPPIAPADQALPKGWVWATLGSLGIIAPRNDAADGCTAGFVPMALISSDFRRSIRSKARQWSEIRSGYTHIADGDVVLAKITPCFENAKSAVVDDLPNGVGAGTTELHVFRPIGEIVDQRYALAFLKSPRFIESGIPRMTGTAGQKRIPADYFALSPFPLPPLAEQKRIVAKVDELMALCDRLEEQQTKHTTLKRSVVESSLHHIGHTTSARKWRRYWLILDQQFGSWFDDDRTIEELRQIALWLITTRQEAFVGGKRDQKRVVRLRDLVGNRQRREHRPRVILDIGTAQFPGLRPKI